MKELLKDLNDNFKGKRELGMIAGVLSLKYGKYIGIASAAPLTTKNFEIPFISPSINDKEIDSICEETDQILV